MKLLSIVSARPNFVKLAAVHHAIDEWNKQGKSPQIEHIIVHTGQHYDPLLSDTFFRELEISEPQVNLEVRSENSNEDTVERTTQAAIPVLKKLHPNLVLVYGDVSGALGGAKAAHGLGIPIAHVEAGLRSFDDTMPEEYNRKEIDKISNLLFVTEQAGWDNLEEERNKEGKNMEGVHFVGNTMIDTLKRIRRKIFTSSSPPHPSRFGLVTLHRPSNVDAREKLERNIEFLNQVAAVCPLIFPVHPRTEASLKRFDLLQMISPQIDRRKSLDYFDFLKLLHQSDFVLTDSGGIQEETTCLGVKCFTLRKNTERPVTTQDGTNTLITDLDDLAQRNSVIDFATMPVDYTERANYALYHQPKYWNGRAGERIVEVLASNL